MLEGWEWLIIGIVAVVIIMWGPAKIPEFAKALGRAKGEFNRAQKEFTNAALTEPPQTTSTASASVSASAPAATKANDDTLLETAKRLSISTEGKTKAEISQEISTKVKSLSA